LPPEPTRDLHATLAELQQQLAEVRSLDPALRRELENAMEEIRARIDSGRDADESLLEGVRDLMLRFEADHPALSDAAGAVVRALARLGI
jgi:Domain of unknown function (DUF4404)